MIVTSLDLAIDDVKPINIGLRNPADTDRYLAKSFFGLDMSDITPRYYGKGLRTGKKFHDYAATKREIVLRIVLNPNYTLNERPADLRDDLYRMISSNRSGEVHAILRNGATSIAEIGGHITKFEVAHFSKVQELQLTINCDHGAIFQGITDVVLDAADLGTTNPYEVNDGLSTCPHGMEMEFEVHSSFTTFYIQDEPASPDWKFELYYPTNFLDGDIIRISSIHPNKGVTLERASVVTPIADKIVAGSFWPIMFPRHNTYYSNPAAEATWREVKYRTAYWGI